MPTCSRAKFSQALPASGSGRQCPPEFLHRIRDIQHILTDFRQFRRSGSLGVIACCRHSCHLCHRPGHLSWRAQCILPGCGPVFWHFIQFWFWLTPIVYPVSILPESVRLWMGYNPMAILIAACQDVLVSGKWPVWQSLLPVAMLALVLCAFGMRLFRKHAGEMVDEL